MATVSTRASFDQGCRGAAVPEGERRHQRRAIVGDAVDGGAVVEQRVDERQLHASLARVDARYQQVHRGLRRPAGVGVGERVDLRSGFE